MSVFAHVDGLGGRIEEIISDAVLSWNKEFCRGQEVSDTIAEKLEAVETTVNVRPAGICLVTVLIRARKPMDCAAYCFRLKRGHVGRWYCSASSISQG